MYNINVCCHCIFSYIMTTNIYIIQCDVYEKYMFSCNKNKHCYYTSSHIMRNKYYYTFLYIAEIFVYHYILKNK